MMVMKLPACCVFAVNTARDQGIVIGQVLANFDQVLALDWLVKLIRNYLLEF